MDEPRDNEPLDEPLEEHPFFFEAAGHSLVGVVTEPSEVSTSAGVLLAPGGGTPSTSIERNGVFVALARTMGGRGLRVLRFDYHGVGDSTGEIHGFRLDRPFVEDMRAAVSCLQDQGVERVIIVGSCFGGRTAMAVGRSLNTVAALVLLAPPTRDYALSERQTEGWGLRDYLAAVVRPRRLVGGSERLTFRRYLRFLRSGARVGVRRVREWVGGRPDHLGWVSRPFLDGFRSLVGRGIPVLFVFGTEDEEYRDFQEARGGELGALLERAGDRAEVIVVPGPVHGFTRIDAQRTVVRIVSDRVAGLAEEVASIRR